MAITVKLTTDLERQVGLAEVQVEPNTPEEVVRQIARQYPASRPYLLNSAGGVRESLVILKDGRTISSSELVPDGAVVDIVFQISGGCT